MAAVADEGRLARAAADGDGAAFATLYDAYEKRIFNFCARLVGSQEDAADATQDAFVKVLQRLPKITGELNFGAYLFTAARNASYDIIGKRKRAEPVEEIGDVTGRPLHGDERGHIDIDPERAAMLAALQESVQAANAKLPERQREVLALRELDDMSYDEIAAVMDMNRNSVAQLISRARIKLRDELVGSALASVSAATPDCQRALPLIAMRQDGQLKDAGDKQWLKDHVGDCATCRVSVEAMEEAGVSYRAWVPIVPLLWLRKATIAKAAERCGFDWSEVADSPRGGDGSSGAGKGSSGEGGTGSGSGGGGGVGAGAGAVVGTVGGLTVAADAKPSNRGHHVRRAILAVLGIALIAVLFMQLLPSDDGDSTTAAKRAAQTSPIVTPLPIVAPVVHHKRRDIHHRAHKAVHKAKHHKRKHHKHHKHDDGRRRVPGADDDGHAHDDRVAGRQQRPRSSPHDDAPPHDDDVDAQDEDEDDHDPRHGWRVGRQDDDDPRDAADAAAGHHDHDPGRAAAAAAGHHDDNHDRRHAAAGDHDDDHDRDQAAASALPAVRGRTASRALPALSIDDQLTPVVADGAPLGARAFVASLGLRDGAPPRVVGAMIGSIDGHATLAGRAGGLGNRADRALLRELRAAADALLVGRNTLTTERYATVLDPDQREARTAEGRPEQPVVATLSRRPAVLADVPLIAEPDVTVVVYAPVGAEPVAGAQLCELEDVSVAAVVADLHESLGAQLIVCEGGPSLLRDLAAAGVLDDLVLTLAPVLVSGDGPSILSGGVLEEPLAMTLAHAARAGDHLMLHYRA